MATEKVTGIVLGTVKHSDRHNVVTLFTRQYGRLPLLVPVAKGKSATARNAAHMPLNVISADINFVKSREMQFPGKYHRLTLWRNIYFDPVKMSITFFISEFLNSYLRFSSADPRLWDYIIAMTSALDKESGSVANFHISFLINFSDYAGVRPDMRMWLPGSLFDMREGVCTMRHPGHRDILTDKETYYLRKLMRMNVRNAHLFRFSSANRREILTRLLRYYAIHFPGTANLKSPEVLSEVFES
ncbi:MAG: DNA repair protein RecO [Candidatus Amulumruptor caecigallinarius]|nr:DNA repair protein RecO [Candidatus Amulumruptor caecigallinarius]